MGYSENKFRFFTFIFAIVVAIALWLLALTARSYHYQIVPLPVGNYLAVDLSLWDATVSSDCNPSIFRSGINTEFCKWIVNRLDGRSIWDVVAFLCTLAFGVGYDSNRCNAFSCLYTASAVFVILTIFSLIFLVALLFSILMFYFYAPTEWLKRATVISSCMASFTSVMSVMMYVFIGGTRANLSAFNSSSQGGLTVLFSNATTLGSGFYIALAAAIWCFTLVPWNVKIINSFLMAQDNDSDYYGESDYERLMQRKLFKELQTTTNWIQTNCRY